MAKYIFEVVLFLTVSFGVTVWLAFGTMEVDHDPGCG